ncbi:MAG: porin [Gammaproteobacteria bacterium]|nr:porin [Gammaproteobacteria bacterium]
MKIKPSLIALAIASAAGAAVVTPVQADVTVYGIAQVEATAVSWQQETPGACDNNDAEVSDRCDGVDLIDNAQGRLGVRATEDLGAGLTGLAVFEFKADTADNDVGAKTTQGNDGAGNTEEAITVSGISLTPREAMVGLKASWGQLELGNLKSAYKYFGGVKYDPFVATTLEARGNGGMSGASAYGQSTALGPNGPYPRVSGVYGHMGFLKEMIGYEYSGGPVNIRVTYGLADGRADYSAGAMYNPGQFELFVALTGTGDTLDNGDGESYDSWKVGGAVKFGAHKLVAQYEQHTYSIDTALEDDEPTHMFIGWNMKLGKNTFVIQGGQLDTDDDTTPNADTTYAALGVIHGFTKSTSVFGGYRMSDADDDSKEDVVTVGLVKKF